MPDPILGAFDPADQGRQQALVEQLLANPAFLEAVRGMVGQGSSAAAPLAADAADAAGGVPGCQFEECPPANEGFPEIRQYIPQPFTMNPGAAATCNVPLVMPPDNSLQASFHGETTPMPYSTTDGPIYMFPGTVNGVDVYGFCVDHKLPSPVGSFGNISIDVALNGQSQQTKQAVAFVIANAPRLPTDDAAEFFEMLGLPCAYGFDGYDARAVARYVIYALLGQLSGGIAGLQFIDREGYPPIGNAKADCLKQACQILLEMALSFGAGTLDCGGSGGMGSGGTGGSACCNGSGTCGGGRCSPEGCDCDDPCGVRLGCQIGKVFCCNTDTPVTDGSSTYLVFAGCANDLRECCGRVVLGPFKLLSSNSGTPSLSLVPCNGCPGTDMQVTDFCCNILAQPPAIGEEFYIAFRPPSCRYCFDLCATMETTSVAVYFFKESGNAAVQRQGLSFPRTDTRTTCIHICIDITPEPPPPEPEPWWEHILVNNNNNNNNNDSSNNANNANSNLLSSALETVLTNLLSSNLMSGLGTGAGPGPPFPPWPGYVPPWTFPPWLGPCPPGPGPGANTPPWDGRFPFPWGLFPPGTTPCPPPACGGPNPCCCPPVWPPGPSPCCAPCPPPCWCPPPVPPCPPPCPPWPCACPEPCFLPFPYIPEPGLILQPAIPTYQAVPMPVPCFCPPPVPPMPFPPQPAPQPFQPYPPYPTAPQAWYPPYDDGTGNRQPVQQVYNPVTVVVPPSDAQPPGQWVGYSAPPPVGMPFQPPEGYGFPQPPSPAQPFYPPAAEPMPPLLPALSSAPRPDLSAFGFADSGPGDAYDGLYPNWYG